jgi:peptide chain release factor 1
VFSRLKAAAERYKELEAELQDPEIHTRPGRMQPLLREMGALKDKAESYVRWQQLQEQAGSAREILAEGGDPDLSELAREELQEVEHTLEQMHAALIQKLVDDEPNRGRAVMVEIRAGAGGDEATLFASDLLRIYSKFSEMHNLSLELLTSHPTDVGGYREVTLSVSGADAWDLFRYEAGGHRVQRVPETEAQGRIHTSAVTVAVLPEADEIEVDIQESDLRLDSYRASGPGGQNVNKTSSAVRITHEPTGTVVQCQDESSWHKNRARAMRMLRTKLLDIQEQALKDEQDKSRRSQIGSGDRSERIRTYNYPQNRVTDHRIKTNYSLDSVLVGRLDQIVDDLKTKDMELKIAAFGEGAHDSD